MNRLYKEKKYSGAASIYAAGIGTTGLSGTENRPRRVFRDHFFRGGNALIRELGLQEGEKAGITVSGGKDSVYMWGVLAELLGREHVQAFTYYKDRISSPVALENVRKVGKVLGSDPIIVRDKEAWKYFRNNLRILIQQPDAAAVRVLLCVGCRYGITENLYRIGEQQGITKYISGASYLELAPFKEELLKEKSVSGDIDEGLRNLVCAYPALEWGDNLFKIYRDQKYKYKNNDTEKNNFSGYRYQLFDFDDYFENDPDRIEGIVKEKYGWEKTDRSWHFDCRIEDIKDVFYFGLLGYTELDYKLEAMVHYGLISEAEQQKKLRKQAQDIGNSLPKTEEFLREFDLEDCIPLMRRFYAEYVQPRSRKDGKL